MFLGTFFVSREIFEPNQNELYLLSFSKGLESLKWRDTLWRNLGRFSYDGFTETNRRLTFGFSPSSIQALLNAQRSSGGGLTGDSVANALLDPEPTYRSSLLYQWVPNIEELRNDVVAAANIGQKDQPKAGVRAYLAKYLRARNGAVDLSTARAAIAFADLDGDGVAEVVAYLRGPGWCGSGGCNAYVLARDGDEYVVRMASTVTRLPIGLLESWSHGWRDLFVWVGGGGGPSGCVAMRYNGAAYPSNPTVLPVEYIEPAAASGDPHDAPVEPLE